MTVRRSMVAALVRIMLDLGRYTLGVIVTSTGILLEVRRGKKRWALAVGSV